MIASSEKCNSDMQLQVQRNAIRNTLRGNLELEKHATPKMNQINK